MAAVAYDEIGVGDVVRSFDFRGNDECYVEGVVVDLPFMQGCLRYAVAVKKRIWDGVVVDFKGEELVYPPANGVPGAPNRVQKVIKNAFN